MLRSPAWKSIAQLVIVVMTAVAIPSLICRSAVIERVLRLRESKPKKVLLASGGVNDIPSGKALLQKSKASWVLIGNSMMNSRFESPYLSQISGQRVFKLTASGTNSVRRVTYLETMGTIFGSASSPSAAMAMSATASNTMMRSDRMMDGASAAASPSERRRTSQSSYRLSRRSRRCGMALSTKLTSLSAPPNTP